MRKVHEKRERKCPKCKSRFGVVLSKSVYIGRSEVICFNGHCNFKISIREWNETYKAYQFEDPGFMDAPFDQVKNTKKPKSYVQK